VARAVTWLFKVGWWSFVVATPILGAWFASSLAAYANGPTWLAASVGLLLFPLLPIAWELWARHRERKRAPKKRILTLGDRLLLRTLAINVLFLGTLVGTRPEAGVRAVSARGDWMLDGQRGPLASSVRRRLLDTADALDWLYRLTHDVPSDDDKPRRDDPPPMPRNDVHQVDAPEAPSDVPEPPPRKPEPVAGSLQRWPIPAQLHPRVREVPAEAEASIATLAAWLVAHENDPFARFKLIHDWVADRISYDVPSLDDGTYPGKQQAQTVFEARTGVCLGYARVLGELAKAAGYPIEVVTGDAKGAGGQVDGAGHAWNVVSIAGARYLVDVTWNAGTVRWDSNGRHVFAKKYATDYLLTPPEVFGVNHFPEHPDDQLRTTPISRGEFMRLPQMEARFFAQGWKLLDPDRSQVTVDRRVDVTLENQDRRFVVADVEPAGGGVRTPCKVGLREADGRQHVSCSLPGAGAYRLVLYDSVVPTGLYDSMGELQVLARGG